MNKYKKWLIYSILVLLIVGIGPLLTIAGFNYFIDPLWNFSHAHQYNNIQRPFDERQTKTNYITHNNISYDTLIIGDSRVTYMSQYDLVGHKAYNYSVSSMWIDEFNDYIEYAKVMNGAEFDTIIIGINFTNTDENRGSPPNDPEYYFNKTNEFLYKYRSLFSRDTFESARENYHSSKQNEHLFRGFRSYDRNNVAYALQVDNSTRDRRIKERVESLKKAKSEYEYNSSYKSLLEEIKMNNPNTNFIIYTTPVTKPMFEAEFKIEARWLAYKQWIEDTIAVFDSMYNFNYVNSVTSELDNFYDSHHSYPGVSTLIAHKIIGYTNPDIPDDFGVLVTNENIDKHLGMLEGYLQNIN